LGPLDVVERPFAVGQPDALGGGALGPLLRGAGLALLGGRLLLGALAGQALLALPGLEGGPVLGQPRPGRRRRQQQQGHRPAEPPARGGPRAGRPPAAGGWRWPRRRPPPGGPTGGAGIGSAAGRGAGSPASSPAEV